MKNHNQIHQKFEGQLEKIMTNDLPHIYSSLAEMKTNIDWLKRNHFIVVTASVGALVAALINLVK